MYKICELIPTTREGALRLGLVTHRQMVTALVRAVENPCVGRRIVEVPEIRSQSGVWRSAQQLIFSRQRLSFFEPSKVMRSITKAPCTWDIYSLNEANEMLYGALTRKTWDKKTTSKKYTAE